jgi:hypothetical protein
MHRCASYSGHKRTHQRQSTGPLNESRTPPHSGVQLSLVFPSPSAGSVASVCVMGLRGCGCAEAFPGGVPRRCSVRRSRALIPARGHRSPCSRRRTKGSPRPPSAGRIRRSAGRWSGESGFVTPGVVDVPVRPRVQRSKGPRVGGRCGGHLMFCVAGQSFCVVGAKVFREVLEEVLRWLIREWLIDGWEAGFLWQGIRVGLW